MNMTRDSLRFRMGPIGRSREIRRRTLCRVTRLVVHRRIMSDKIGMLRSGIVHFVVAAHKLVLHLRAPNAAAACPTFSVHRSQVLPCNLAVAALAWCGSLGALWLSAYMDRMATTAWDSAMGCRLVFLGTIPRWLLRGSVVMDSLHSIRTYPRSVAPCQACLLASAQVCACRCASCTRPLRAFARLHHVTRQ